MTHLVCFCAFSWNMSNFETHYGHVSQGQTVPCYVASSLERWPLQVEGHELLDPCFELTTSPSKLVQTILAQEKERLPAASCNYGCSPTPQPWCHLSVPADLNRTYLRNQRPSPLKWQQNLRLHSQTKPGKAILRPILRASPDWMLTPLS